MRRSIFAAFSMGLAMAVAAPVAAETFAYRCTIRDADERDWIQPLIFVAHDTAEGRVIVSDRVILSFNDGQPVTGRLITENALRITFGWNVDVTLRVSPVRLSYRATYLKSSGVVNISATASGRYDTIVSGGTCEMQRLNG